MVGLRQQLTEAEAEARQLGLRLTQATFDKAQVAPPTSTARVAPPAFFWHVASVFWVTVYAALDSGIETLQKDLSVSANPFVCAGKRHLVVWPAPTSGGHVMMTCAPGVPSGWVWKSTVSAGLWSKLNVPMAQQST